MQISFSRLWDNIPTDKQALTMRNERAKILRAKGYNVACFTLRNQIKQYDGFGQPNGASCNVYMLDFQETPEMTKRLNDEALSAKVL